MNKRLLMLIMISVVIVITITGLSYAYFVAILSGNQDAKQTVLQTGVLRITLTDTEVISLPEALPGSSATKVFKVENTGTVAIKYNIELTDVINEFVNNDLVFSITSTKREVSETPVPIEESYLMKNMAILPSEEQIYTLKITFKETGINQNENMGAIFTGKLQIDVTEDNFVAWEENCRNNQNTIGCTILSDNEIKTNADFTKSSEESGEYGLYQTIANASNIYYYRGGDHCENSNGTLNTTYTDKTTCEANGLTWVTLNNNIIFAEKCWQIIRTNEEGSTRVIYNGVPVSGKCTATGAGAQIGTSPFNSETKVINSKAYNMWTDVSAVGYTLGSPEGSTYQIYRGTSAVTSDLTINYNAKVGTGYTLDEETGIITLTGVETVSSSVAPSTTLKYYLSGGGTTGTYLYEIASDAVITHNSSSSNYTISKTWRLSANWSKSEAKATSNEIDSTIKTYLENWYSINMTSYNSYLEDAGYCNDRSLYNNTLGYGSSGYYGGWYRLASNKTPSNECKNEERDLYTSGNDKGNGNSTYPIGLITADELAYGGQKLSFTTTKNNYLYTGAYYWSLSPSYFYPSGSNSNVWYVNSAGNFSYYSVYFGLGGAPRSFFKI